jgi:hypothetical protein
MNEFGEPNMGNPSVRFDEGRERVGRWPLAFQSNRSCLLYKSWKFSRLQRRRSQCEGRIGIVKNNFLGRPLRSKGFASRQLAVSWAVLTHNLWVIARLPQRKARNHTNPQALAA